MRHIGRLLAISRRYWGWMCLAFVAMVGVTGTTLAGPWLLRSLVGVIERSIGVQPLPIGQVVRVAVILLGVYALRPAFCSLQTRTAHVAGWGSVASARQAIYDHLQRLSPRDYSDTQTGQIMSHEELLAANGLYARLVRLDERPAALQLEPAAAAGPAGE